MLIRLNANDSHMASDAEMITVIIFDRAGKRHAVRDSRIDHASVVINDSDFVHVCSCFLYDYLLFVVASFYTCAIVRLLIHRPGAGPSARPNRKDASCSTSNSSIAHSPC